MVEPEQRYTNQGNATECSAPHSDITDRTFIDLTDDPDDRVSQQFQQFQQSPESKKQECSQEGEPPEETPAMEVLLPGISRAASVFVESSKAGSEENQAQLQKSPAESPEKGKPAMDRDGKGERLLGEDFNSSTLR